MDFGAPELTVGLADVERAVDEDASEIEKRTAANVDGMTGGSFDDKPMGVGAKGAVSAFFVNETSDLFDPAIGDGKTDSTCSDNDETNSIEGAFASVDKTLEEMEETGWEIVDLTDNAASVRDAEESEAFDLDSETPKFIPPDSGT